MGVVELVRRLRTGETLVAEHLADVLERIRQRDGQLNAFSAFNPEAMAQAQALDWLPFPQRDELPLFGVPVAIKEELNVAGMVTTFGGRANSTPATQDSDVVARLRRAGAVIVGKTNMPEFGQTPFTEGEWGATRNPYDPRLSPGGSSGGSAVAVAAKMVPLAIGGDAGGSIRIPAAMTGIVGIKPSRGLVNTTPFPHLWHDLGSYGPLAREVADVRLVIDLITSEPSARRPPQPLRVGWTLGSPVPGIKPDRVIGQAVADAAQRLAMQGCEVSHGSIKWAETPATFVVQYLRGVHDEVMTMDHPERLERRSRQAAYYARRLPQGALEWSKASISRIEAAMRQVFTDIDVLLTPVTPTLPQPIRAIHRKGFVGANLASSRAIAYTSYWNLAGLPAASVPVGLSPTGLPLAVQIIGPWGAESLVLEVASRIHHPIAPPAYS